ncbi:phage tail tape measure protein [Nocardia sp. NPDC050697]|uniref:phage tail tape measure protein n=1 Tax=Nocardia sp. NPDC050697 TaxID=3155158 RepID=UPI0033DF483A
MPQVSASDLTLTIKAVDQASAILRKVNGAIDTTTESAGKFGDSLTRIRDVALGVYLPQLGARILSAGAQIITAAGDFEQGMNVFQGISGATATEMERVGKKAQELGNDITLPGVSAKTAADAMTELAKAGLSVNETMAASKGVLALAKAGQLQTADAATITANALLAFNLSGSEASRVADLLAAAANASSADVSDMGMALQQSAAVAAQTKRPVEDLTAQIALMANAGIKGSDAGTSLKTMMSVLSAPTDVARAALNELGVSVYDTGGKMKTTRDLILQFTQGLKNKTDAQKNDLLHTVFGSDAIRAASIVIGGGVKKYDEMTTAVTKAGAAQKLAASYSQGWNGIIQSVGNTLETVSLRIGLKLLPTLNRVGSVFANELGPTLDGVLSTAGRISREVGSYLAPGLGRLAAAVKQQVIPTLTILNESVIKPLATVIGGTLVIGIGLLVDALTFLSSTARPLTATLLGVGAALAALKFGQLVMGVYAFAVALDVAAIASRGMAVALALLNINPIVLAASALIGAFTMLAALQGPFAMASNNTKAAIERHKSAQDALNNSMREAKAAQDALKGALLDQEGASIRVEQAQRNLERAVRDFGPKSLEARQASYDLKQAQQALGDATQRVAEKTDEVKRKQEEVVARKDQVKKAAAEMRDAANESAGGFRNLANTMQDVVNRQQTIKAGTANGSSSPLTLDKMGIKLPGHARGTNYAPGGLTIVGEEGPELVNLPRGSRVTPAAQTRQVLGASQPAQINVTQIINSKVDYMQGMAELGFMLRGAAR